MKFRKIIINPFIVGIGFSVLWSTAMATTSFSLDVGGGYDSNPNLLEVGDEGSSTWTVHPQLYFEPDTSTAYQWFLTGGYEVTTAELESQIVDSSYRPGSPITISTPNT